MPQLRFILRLFIVTLMVAATGCQTTRQPAPVATIPRDDTPRSKDPIDACAERLHDISGLLLMYCMLNKQLPPSLSDVLAIGDIDKQVPLVCPVSGRPYVYDRQGFQIADKPGRLVIYDAEPAHDGKRWVISVQESDGPLITHVFDITEQQFTARFRNVPMTPK